MSWISLLVEKILLDTLLRSNKLIVCFPQCSFKCTRNWEKCCNLGQEILRGTSFQRKRLMSRGDHHKASRLVRLLNACRCRLFQWEFHNTSFGISATVDRSHFLNGPFFRTGKQNDDGTCDQRDEARCNVARRTETNRDWLKSRRVVGRSRLGLFYRNTLNVDSLGDTVQNTWNLVTVHPEGGFSVRLLPRVDFTISAVIGRKRSRKFDNDICVYT